jgi:hypothetical protein
MQSRTSLQCNNYNNKRRELWKDIGPLRNVRANISGRHHTWWFVCFVRICTLEAGGAEINSTIAAFKVFQRKFYGSSPSFLPFVLVSHLDRLYQGMMTWSLIVVVNDRPLRTFIMSLVAQGGSPWCFRCQKPPAFRTS